MTNFANIARPYALAAFEYARDCKQLADWQSFLTTAAKVAEDSTIIKLLANPMVSADKLQVLFTEVLTDFLDAGRKNFLILLAQHKRLVVLPDILALFNAHYATLEKMRNVRVITAIEAKDEFRQQLAASLSKRIRHDVTLHCEIDPAILGGAVIHMGDSVIDGSVLGKLTRLRQTLTD